MDISPSLTTRTVRWFIVAALLSGSNSYVPTGITNRKGVPCLAAESSNAFSSQCSSFSSTDSPVASNFDQMKRIITADITASVANPRQVADLVHDRMEESRNINSDLERNLFLDRGRKFDGNIKGEENSSVGKSSRIGRSLGAMLVAPLLLFGSLPFPSTGMVGVRNGMDMGASISSSSSFSSSWMSRMSAVSNVRADDELAKFAAEGHKVGVDGQCFMKKCALETSKCINDASCVKGLSCLARCKGGSLCSTGCFAKYGSPRLDDVLACSVEKNDCVQVPGKSNKGWTEDKLSDLPAVPLKSFHMADLEGNWYKVMGLDTRYDCFDCQRNEFHMKDKDAHVLKMEAMFRIPRPTDPGFSQNNIAEELHATDPASRFISHMQSQGQMFGLTFWENWYVLGESKPPLQQALGIPLAFAGSSDAVPDMKLVYYTGHTLQGSYKGAFLYSRSSEMTPGVLKAATQVIAKAGLNPNDFCVIRNQCFLSDSNSKSDFQKSRSSTPGSGVLAAVNPGSSSSSSGSGSGSAGGSKMKRVSFPMADADAEKDKYSDPFWYLGQNFFKATKLLAEELADWFEDPAIVSEWLVNQQEHMVLRQPLAVSPFAALEK